MISDTEFWAEVRRREGGRDDIFKSMLALIHFHQCRIDACVGGLDQEEYNTTRYWKECLALRRGATIPTEERNYTKVRNREKEHNLVETKGNSSLNESPRVKTMGTRQIATVTIRVLQQVMLYAVPIYKLRYSIPAMSMSWSNSCIIDFSMKRLITFGSGQGVQVPGHIQGRGCVAGDGFFAILTDRNEVWASSALKISNSSSVGATPLGRDNAMIGVATKVVMLAGHTERLAYLTNAFTVRSLSAVCAPTRSIIPSRRTRFLDLGYGDDYYMVGMDSILYKTTASKGTVSTPRRVMSFSQRLISRISSGLGFLLIIDQNGHLYTNGRNRCGQLGNGKKQDTHRKPCLVKSLKHHFITQVAAGEWHSLALTSSGIVYSAGSNDNGQLGLGPDVKESPYFTQVPLPTKCVGIAAGPVGSMFACEDGQVLTCGLNDCMQLGVDMVDKIVYKPTPIPLISGVETYTMDFGGYMQKSRTPSQVMPKEYNVGKENDFPGKDTCVYLKPTVQRLAGSDVKGIIESGESGNFNGNNGIGYNLCNRPSDKRHIKNISADNRTSTHSNKSHNGQPEYQRINGDDSVNVFRGSENVNDGPLLVSNIEAHISDPQVRVCVTNTRESRVVNLQKQRVDGRKCTSCCIVS